MKFDTAMLPKGIPCRVKRMMRVTTTGRMRHHITMNTVAVMHTTLA